MKKFDNGNNAKIITHHGFTPDIDPTCFLAEGSIIIGDVKMGKQSSVWHNSVIRGDVHYIRIGERTNIQDLSALHVTNGTHPLQIGNGVSIGHRAMVHGCTIKDNSLIGIGAIVLDGAIVNSYSLVAAGTVVKEGFVVPEGTLIAGVPGKVVRELTEKERKEVAAVAGRYIEYAAAYRQEYRDYYHKDI